MTKKTLVISDFEQVGKLTEEDFRRLNAQLKRHHISRLIAVGSSFEGYRGVFDLEEQLFFHDTADLLSNLPNIPISYEIILVKGARNFHFEQVVNALQHKTHLTIMQVNLPALAYNLNYHRNRLRPDTKMVAMVKASSYGLGDVELVNTLVDQGVDYLAVAYTDEGVRLRKRRIDTPIIVLGAEAHSFEVMVNHRLEPEIFNFYYLQQLEEVLARHPEIPMFNIHIKVDTGMHRLGFDMQDLPRLIDIVKHNPKLRIASVFSHLAAAEDPAEDAFTRRQIALFGRMTDVLCAAFDYKILRHILNSAGIVRFPEAQFDMVRLGIQLYGCSEIPEMTLKLHNVVTLKTVITQIKQIPAGETIGYNRTWRLQRDTQVAIIPIGYADGYPRELCNGRGTVLVQGQKVPVIGKVCMDMCMLDITGLRVHEGDEVIVYGEGNTVSDMADAAGLISYELMTRISQRVPRVYVQE
jgi:alanine racemase